MEHLLTAPPWTARLASAMVLWSVLGGCVSGGVSPLFAAPKPGALRFATFNTSFNRPVKGQLAVDLASPTNAQAQAVAEIIQLVRPDVLLLNEFDYDKHGESLRLFQDNYLRVGQNGADPIAYRFSYLAPVNTGIDSGHDLDHDGSVGGAGDAFGFGHFPGQYGMVLLSRFPIATERVRTFQNLRWINMPGALIPRDWYSEDATEVLRLSSKSHWDVPIDIDGAIIHALVSHPTPPAFDGPEDRNGKRNHDEIRFWSDYITPGAAGWIVDDQGLAGGIDAGVNFVILGDLNSDPNDGGSIASGIRELLAHPLVDSRQAPSSPGGAEQSRMQGGASDTHTGNPAHDTSDFNDRPGSPGNLRADYALPSRTLHVIGAGVFWPLTSDPVFDLVGTFPFPSSDHRLVWVDVAVK